MDFNALKTKMINEHLKARGITDEALVAAFSEVNRQDFVSDDLKSSSYEDRPLPIGCSQTISQPYIVALMLQSLGLGVQDRVLEIGTGSGYQTALLLCLVDKVYSIERHDDLADRAKKALSKHSHKLHLSVGDGTLGSVQFAPYDAIVLSAAAPKIPKCLIDQLKVGGKLIMPVGDRFGQNLIVAKKISKNEIEQKSICSCVFVPLIGEHGVKE